MGRVAITKQTIQSLRRFYGGRTCVISGCNDNTDWHHLDNDPSRSIFSNILPLGRDYNNRLEIYRRLEEQKSTWIGIHPFLSPDHLLTTSSFHFMSGLPALAYGCARLAAWLIILYKHIFHTYKTTHLAKCIAQSLSTARHAAAPELLTDILQRDIKAFLSSGAPSGLDILAIKLECASILQDYSKLALANAIFEDISAVICSMRGDDVERLRLKLLRRKAISNIVIGCRLNETQGFLQYPGPENENGNLRAAIANGKAWLSLANQNPSAAIDELEPVIKNIFNEEGFHRKEVVTYWNALETLLTYHTAIHQIDGRLARKLSRTREQILFVMQSNTAVQLRPVALTVASGMHCAVPSDTLALYKQGIIARPDGASPGLIDAVDLVMKQLEIPSRVSHTSRAD